MISLPLTLSLGVMTNIKSFDAVTLRYCKKKISSSEKRIILPKLYIHSNLTLDFQRQITEEKERPDQQSKPDSQLSRKLSSVLDIPIECVINKTRENQNHN